jgi:hypothetical protein
MKRIYGILKEIIKLLYCSNNREAISSQIIYNCLQAHQARIYRMEITIITVLIRNNYKRNLVTRTSIFKNLLNPPKSKLNRSNSSIKVKVKILIIRNLFNI